MSSLTSLVLRIITFHTHSNDRPNPDLLPLGIYEKPSWLSQGSVALLDAMLQTDPKRRITVKELLTHPWLMDGYESPIKWQSRYHQGELDPEVVGAIAAFRMTSVSGVSEQLKKWDYSSNLVCTYFLLLDRKQRGMSVSMRSDDSPGKEVEFIQKYHRALFHNLRI